MSEGALLKGLSSRGMSFEGSLYAGTSSSIVEETGREGDGGGGDCTRTFFCVFFDCGLLWKLVVGSACEYVK